MILASMTVVKTYDERYSRFCFKEILKRIINPDISYRYD